MGWQGAVVAAIGAAGYQQAGAIGSYQQAAFDRKAKVYQKI